METDTLLRVTPKEIAESLLLRRRVLKEQLPNIVKTLDGEGESLSPKVKKIKEKNDVINQKISQFKNTRDALQNEAREILNDVKAVQDGLTKTGSMVNLDPKWKKERVLEELQDIEFKIQTAALDHRAEKKMLDSRKRILQQNEKWLKERKESNPEMAEYIKKRKKMNALYKEADKAHLEMIKNVEKGKPIHEKYVALKTDLNDINRQKDRAKELLAKSDRDITYWENMILEGFESLLEPAKIVTEGGASSFVSKNNIKRKNQNKNNKKVEEE